MVVERLGEIGRAGLRVIGTAITGVVAAMDKDVRMEMVDSMVVIAGDRGLRSSLLEGRLLLLPGDERRLALQRIEAACANYHIKGGLLNV